MIQLPVLRVMMVMSTMMMITMTMVVLEMLIRQQHWKKNSEYLFEDAEQYTAMPDNDGDWGSGSHQTQTSTGTADDDEGTEGHNYERVE